MGVGHWMRKHPTSELADWWDKNSKQLPPDPIDKMNLDSQAQVSDLLSDFVDAHPHLWVIAVTVQSLADIGHGVQYALNINARLNDLSNSYVDVLRFGEGAADFHETGKIAPLIQDILRGGTIASAAAKEAQSLRPILGNTLGLFESIDGQICAPLSLRNAARLTGQSLFIKLQEVLDGFGIKLSDVPHIAGTDPSQFAHVCDVLKIRYRSLGAGKSFEELANVVERGEGVVALPLENPNHRVLLVKTRDGVRILDSTKNRYFRNLLELSNSYQGSIAADFAISSKWDSILVKNISVKMLNGVPTLFVAANASLKLAGHTTVAQLDEKFRQFKATRSGSAGGTATGSTRITVAGGDTLSDLAQKYYGSKQFWPLLWDANRAAIGPNPNFIRRGMVLSVPPMSNFNSAQLQDAKQRFSTWRNY